MNELQKMTSNLSLANGVSREKNLYKVQSMLCPQIYAGKNVEEIKNELYKNTILFGTTSDEDFMALLKLAINMYVEERKLGKRIIFNGDYIVGCNEMLMYLRRYNLNSWEDLIEYVQANYNSDLHSKIYSHLISEYMGPVTKDWTGAYTRCDVLEIYSGIITQKELENIKV